MQFCQSNMCKAEGLRLNFGTKLYGFTNIGVIPSLLIDAKTIMPVFLPDGYVFGNKTIDVTNRVSKFDFAGLIEIGGGYKFKGRYWLFTSFSYSLNPLIHWTEFVKSN